MSGKRRNLVEKINNAKNVKTKLSKACGNSAVFVLCLGILWQKLLCILPETFLLPLGSLIKQSVLPISVSAGFLVKTFSINSQWEWKLLKS